MATLCRDVRAERVEELILIWTNARLPRSGHDRTEPAGQFPKLWVSNLGCARWTGTVEVIQRQPNLTYELRATVTYDRIAPPPGAVLGLMPLSYRATQGEMPQRVDGRTEACRAHGGGSAAVDPEASPMSTFSHLLAGPFHRRAGFVLHSAPDAFTLDIDAGRAGRSRRDASRAARRRLQAVRMSADGGLMEGEETLGANTTVRWRLEAQRE